MGKKHKEKRRRGCPLVQAGPGETQPNTHDVAKNVPDTKQTEYRSDQTYFRIPREIVSFIYKVTTQLLAIPRCFWFLQYCLCGVEYCKFLYQ